MKHHDLSSTRDIVIRDVPVSTRLKLILFADMRRVSIGNALDEIAEQHRSNAERDPLVAKMGQLAFEGANLSLLASGGEDVRDTWLVRDVAETTHRTIKGHAWGNGLTMAEGLGQIVDNYLRGDASNDSEPITEQP